MVRGFICQDVLDRMISWVESGSDWIFSCTYNSSILWSLWTLVWLLFEEASRHFLRRHGLAQSFPNYMWPTLCCWLTSSKLWAFLLFFCMFFPQKIFLFPFIYRPIFLPHVEQFLCGLERYMIHQCYFSIIYIVLYYLLINGLVILLFGFVIFICFYVYFYVFVFYIQVFI